MAKEEQSLSVGVKIRELFEIHLQSSNKYKSSRYVRFQVHIQANKSVHIPYLLKLA